MQQVMEQTILQLWLYLRRKMERAARNAAIV
jgi:hypothetical protein